MDKFWTFIQNKGYGFKADDIAYNSLYTDTSFTSEPIPKQMLIGYMIEYLFFKDYCVEELPNSRKIDDLYDKLVYSIEGLE